MELESKEGRFQVRLWRKYAQNEKKVSFNHFLYFQKFCSTADSSCIIAANGQCFVDNGSDHFFYC